MKIKLNKCPKPIDLNISSYNIILYVDINDKDTNRIGRRRG
jgi:hypothetical protein